MPPSDKINDYEKFENPRWYLEVEDVEDELDIEDDVQITQKSKFIL